MLYSTTEYYLIYLTYVYIDADDTLYLTMYASDTFSGWRSLFYDRNPCKHIYNTFYHVILTSPDIECTLPIIFSPYNVKSFGNWIN